MWASTSLAGLFAAGGTILQDVETNTGGEWFCTVTQHHFLCHYYACYSQECAPCTRGRQRALPPCKRSDGHHRSFFSTRGIAPRGARVCTFFDSTSSITACAGVTLQQSPSGFSLTEAEPLSEKSFATDSSVHFIMEATLPTNLGVADRVPVPPNDADRLVAAATYFESIKKAAQRTTMLNHIMHANTYDAVTVCHGTSSLPFLTSTRVGLPPWLFFFFKKKGLAHLHNVLHMYLFVGLIL